jgi:hypothetical protein
VVVVEYQAPPTRIKRVLACPRAARKEDVASAIDLDSLGAHDAAISVGL